MHAKIESLLDCALAHSPIQPLFKWRAARRLVVLAYHEVNFPERFEEHLDYLRQSASVIDADQLLDAIAGRKGLPKNAVLLTFDDGDRSVYEVARPLLRERGMPGVVFPIVGALNSRCAFWWDEAIELIQKGACAHDVVGLPAHAAVSAMRKMQNSQRLAVLDELRSNSRNVSHPVLQLKNEDIQEMKRYGLEVGNHTYSHPVLPACTDAEAQSEIERAHIELTSILGHGPRLFAYPNGAYDARVISTLQELDYGAAFLFDHRLSQPRQANKWQISRARVNASTSMDRFRIISSGLHPAIHHFIGRH